MLSKVTIVASSSTYPTANSKISPVLRIDAVRSAVLDDEDLELPLGGSCDLPRAELVELPDRKIGVAQVIACIQHQLPFARAMTTSATVNSPPPSAFSRYILRPKRILFATICGRLGA